MADTSGAASNLTGGSGDDAFFIDGSTLNLGTHVNGGAGVNAVSFTAGSGTVVDSELYAALTHVQSIDFTASGVDASLNLSGAQIADMSGGATTALTLQFNVGDSLTITDNPANYTQSTVGSTTTYTIYDDAIHTNQIAQLIVAA